VLDQALRDVAAQSAAITYRLCVKRIQWADGAWHLTLGERRVAFDAVILATGAADQLSRQLGVAGEPVIGASVSVYVHGDDVLAPVFQFVGLGAAGDGWMFPLAAGRINLGVCAVDAGPKRLRAAAGSYMQRWNVTMAGRIRGGAGPMWSGRGRQWHDPRGLVSCGDAAGLVDPVTGEGITAALVSGRAAGMAMDAFLREGQSSAKLRSYSDWVATSFRARYEATPVRRSWAYLNEASRPL